MLREVSLEDAIRNIVLRAKRIYSSRGPIITGRTYVRLDKISQEFGQDFARWIACICLAGRRLAERFNASYEQLSITIALGYLVYEVSQGADKDLEKAIILAISASNDNEKAEAIRYIRKRTSKIEEIIRKYMPNLSIKNADYLAELAVVIIKHIAKERPYNISRCAKSVGESSDRMSSSEYTNSQQNRQKSTHDIIEETLDKILQRKIRITKYVIESNPLSKFSETISFYIGKTLTVKDIIQLVCSNKISPLDLYILLDYAAKSSAKELENMRRDLEQYRNNISSSGSSSLKTIATIDRYLWENDTTLLAEILASKYWRVDNKILYAAFAGKTAEILLPYIRDLTTKEYPKEEFKRFVNMLRDIIILYRNVNSDKILKEIINKHRVPAEMFVIGINISGVHKMYKVSIPKAFTESAYFLTNDRCWKYVSNYFVIAPIVSRTYHLTKGKNIEVHRRVLQWLGIVTPDEAIIYTGKVLNISIDTYHENKPKQQQIWVPIEIIGEVLAYLKKIPPYDWDKEVLRITRLCDTLI